MKTTPRTLVLLAGLLLMVGQLSAQPSIEPKSAAPAFEYSVSGAFTASSDVEINDANVGDVSVNQWQLNAVYKYPALDRLMLDFGVSLQQLHLDTSGSSVLLPDTLQGLALSLGGSWQVNPKWALIATVRPGRYNDTEADSSDSFSAPGVIVARWSASRDLTVFFGARVHPLSDDVVLPVAGARWQLRPDWVLSIGFPRTEAAYTFDPNTVFFAGAGFDAGSYAIDDPAIVAPVGRDLRNTKLDYRAVRASFGVQRKLGPRLQLRLEGGMAFERRFDYYNRGVKVKPDDAGYGALTISTGF